MSLSSLLAREGRSLLPQGRLMVGVCPRCAGATPSLQVYGELFRCTHCGLAGGSLQYLVASGKSAAEAASELGIRLTVPKRIRRALQMAEAIFEETLWSGPGELARDYLCSRGIDRQVLPRFHLGATPPVGTLSRRLLCHGFGLAELTEAGLLRCEHGGYTEQLRSRVVFPLCDPIGRTLGFAGRALSPGALKYVNTKASVAGSGRDTLFGLPQAKQAIVCRRQAWIVEGYLDAVACHQVHLDWVVAAGGTHLTLLQALQLRRLTSRVVLLLDGGTLPQVISRAVTPLHNVGLDVLAATLPPDMDPDVLVLQEGPDALARVARGARRLGVRRSREVAT